MIKKILLILCTLVLIVILGAGGLFYMEYSRKTKEGKEIEVEIPEGSSTRSVAALLKEKGIIRFELPFLVKVSRSQYRGKIRYGVFVLNDGMSLDAIIENLATGGKMKENLVLTIPEGYTAARTA